MSARDIDLDNVLAIDDATPRQRYLNPHNAWLITSLETRIWVEGLTSLRFIIPYTPLACDAPVIPWNGEWCRLDLVLDRPHHRAGKLYYRIRAVRPALSSCRLSVADVLAQHPQAMCLGESDEAGKRCRFNGVYEPQTDSVLYCIQCERWFHEHCMVILGPLAGLREEERDVLPESLLNTEDANEHIARWERLLSIPIQRRYPHVFGPPFATYERILVAAHRRPNLVSPNIDNFIRKQAKSDGHRLSDEDLNVIVQDMRALEKIDPASRLVFRCPFNHVV